MKEMLASCCRRCDERGLISSLYETDLKELSLPHKYEAIIIPCGSFLLIEQREKAIQALKTLESKCVEVDLFYNQYKVCNS